MSDSLPGADVILARYVALPAALEKAISGLTETQLDLARKPGTWTIRQLVHHIVDGDDITKTLLKAAVGNEGSRFEMEWYPTDNRWARTTDYTGRGIAPAIDLLRANHRHVEQILDRVPDGMSRFLMIRRQGASEYVRATVAELIHGQTEHARYHLTQIRETREAHAV